MPTLAPELIPLTTTSGRRVSSWAIASFTRRPAINRDGGEGFGGDDVHFAEPHGLAVRREQPGLGMMPSSFVSKIS